MFKNFCKIRKWKKKDLKQTPLQMDRVKRIWYLSPMRAAKVKAGLRMRAVSPELSLFAHTSSESRGTFRQKARSQAPLNGWACAVEICHDGMLEDTNSLDGAQMMNGFPVDARLGVNVLYKCPNYNKNQKNSDTQKIAVIICLKISVK